MGTQQSMIHANQRETQTKENNLKIVDYAADTKNRPYDHKDYTGEPRLTPAKTSFLVFKDNKYTTVRTENIAYFYVKYDSTIIVCFDKREYCVNYSLENVQKLVTEKQFFRLNRQYLINFQAVKEAELYFARKLLVTLVIAVVEKLLVPRDKASQFLAWMENR
jgi:two-component system response regulator LytT